MGKEIKVLLVDDEADFRSLMSFWLKSKGYSVIFAADGKKAVEMTKKEKPDIIFMDLNMPVMDGVEALKRIRRIDKKLPVIVISAHADSPQAAEANRYDISGVFYKGENFESALPLLEAALRTHKKLKR